MNRERIMQEARENIERLGGMTKPQNNRLQKEAIIKEDKLTKWRKDVEAQEREFAAARRKRQAEANAEQDSATRWMAWVGQQIKDAVAGVGRGLGEILSEKLAKISEAFDKRDQRINQLECELYRTSANLEQLRVRVIKGEIERDHKDDGEVIDVSPPSKTRAVN
jgi:hypothetical protein